MSNNSPSNHDADPGWISSRNAVGVREVLAIARGWGLETHELAILLGTTPETLDHWRVSADVGEGLELDQEVVERISYLHGINVALKTLFTTMLARLAWLRNCNTGPAFNGRAPLDHMLTGATSGLRLVRSVLDTSLG